MKRIMKELWNYIENRKAVKLIIGVISLAMILTLCLFWVKAFIL